MNLTSEFNLIQKETGDHQWMTRFKIDDNNYGGYYSYEDDPRVKDFLGWAPGNKLEHILELGSCEGGQSIELAKSDWVKSVHGLDGKSWLVDRSTKVLRLLPPLPITFSVCNFDSPEHLNHLSKMTADSVFCSGVLYHLTEPWKLIKALIPVTDWLYLATHFTPSESTLLRGGYRGIEVPEPYNKDVWSGMADKVFWFTLPELVRCLMDLGWSINLMRVWPNWIHPGDTDPMVGILCNH